MTLHLGPSGRPPQIRLAILGHVDHGKSTVVGRLLDATGALPEGKVAAVRAAADRRGMPFEWAFVTDALKTERDQGVTIEAAHIQIRRPGRDLLLVDAPGHRAFLRNMLSGAASCDAALLVIDAGEGMGEQSRRHALLAGMLGLERVIVAVNKMDLAGFDPVRFAAIRAEITGFFQRLGGTAPVAVLPLAARDGDGIVTPGPRLAWYDGPSLLAAIDALPLPEGLDSAPLRLPVQDVYRFDDRRVIAGRIESGTLAVGDTILISPVGGTARVTRIELWPAQLERAQSGRSVAIELDAPLFADRGEVISHPHDPPMLSDVFRARIFWLDAHPLEAGRRLTLRLGTRAAPVEVETILSGLDPDTLAETPGGAIPGDAVGMVVLRSPALLALDSAAGQPRAGRFMLSDDGRPVGGGLIDMSPYPDQRRVLTRRASNLTPLVHRVDAEMRRARNRHAGGVLWLTGLSGAGKSTLAQALEPLLFQAGYQTYLLDGDNIRNGLCRDLGFLPEDRAENIRRVGEVAALFADAGMLVISAFISPYRADRARAQAAAGQNFHEIYIKASLDTCEGRDNKGLYARARRGEIADFTGISAPYECPLHPVLTIDTDVLNIGESVADLLAYVKRCFPLE